MADTPKPKPAELGSGLQKVPWMQQVQQPQPPKPQGPPPKPKPNYGGQG